MLAVSLYDPYRKGRYGMGKRVLLLVNSSSGQEKGKALLYSFVEEFAKKNCVVTVFPILPRSRKLSTDSIVHKYKEAFDLMVCVGGDGTLHYLVSSVLEEGLQVPIGYIPTGSTNDFAASLGIPKDWKENIDGMVKGKPFYCDIGQLNEKYFNYIAAFGAFTKVSYGTEQKLKNNLGYMAYLLESIRTMPENLSKSYRLQVRSEEFSEEGEYIFGAVSNSRSVAGFSGFPGSSKEEKWNVDLQDGKFEVLLIRTPKNIADFGEILATIIGGVIPEDNPQVQFFKTSHLFLSAKEEVEWTVDGEFGGAYREMELKVMEKKVGVMLPSED